MPWKWYLRTPSRYELSDSAVATFCTIDADAVLSLSALPAYFTKQRVFVPGFSENCRLPDESRLPLRASEYGGVDSLPFCGVRL